MDGIGRVVIPTNVRREQGIYPMIELSIAIEGDDAIVLSIRGCAICRTQSEWIDWFPGKRVCSECHSQPQWLAFGREDRVI